MERKARNQRNFAACYCGLSSGFEAVQGLLDRVLLSLGTAPLGLKGKNPDSEVVDNSNGYWIEGIDDPTYFPGRAAAIYVRLDGETQRVGQFGILRPDVLEAFDIQYPVSALEFNLEAFL